MNSCSCPSANRPIIWRKWARAPSLADQPAIKRLQKHAERAGRFAHVHEQSVRPKLGLGATNDRRHRRLRWTRRWSQGKVDEEDRKQILDDIRALEPGPIHAGARRNIGRSGFSPPAGTKAFQYNDGQAADDGQLQAALDPQPRGRQPAAARCLAIEAKRRGLRRSRRLAEATSAATSRKSPRRKPTPRIGPSTRNSATAASRCWSDWTKRTASI